MKSPFVLRMIVRELRLSFGRLVFFFLCIAVGVGAVVALRSVLQTARGILTREAKALIAADVVLQTDRPWDKPTLDLIARREAGAPVLETTEAIETGTMVRPADSSKRIARMVELRGVEARFPFYGRVVLGDGRPYHHALLANGGALVGPELLGQLDVRVGDTILIGRRPFQIRGTVDREPGRRLGAFSLGPRVLIDLEDLKRAGLLDFGSRARYQRLLRVRDDRTQALVTQLRQDLADRFVNVRWARGTEDQVGRELVQTENYLSLVGFVILVLGGVGVWSVTRVFVHQKIRAIAILKCLGASTRQIITTYLAQAVLLGAGGSLAGVLLAAVVVAALPAGPLEQFDARYRVTLSAALQGMGIGLLVSLLFALIPLLDVRHVKPLLLLRDETQRRAGLRGAGLSGPPRSAISGVQGAPRVIKTRWHADWMKIAAIALVAVALVGVATWQAGSLRVGLYVCGGFLAITVVLQLAAWGLVRAVRPLAQVTWFPLRHAVLSLSRPGNQTRVVLMAVGIGSFFILGVRSLQTNLLRELAVEMRPDAPDLFLVDVQADQVEGLRAFLSASTGKPPRLLPVLRARVTGVQGKNVKLNTVEEVRKRGGLGREYVITYRDRLESNEKVLQGRFFENSGGAEVSIEEGIRERTGIQLGDRLRFDVLGRMVTARVTSVREVEWGDARAGGFMFVFRPDTFSGAPHSYIGILKGPPDAAARGRLQRAITDRFPNVTAIDVHDVLRTIQQVLGNVTLAISIVGLVTLVSGVLILIGSVAMTKFQRLYEAAIFRSLGASTRTIAAMLAIEYGLLGGLAGIVGAAGAAVLSWAVSRNLLEIRWTPLPGLLTGGVLAATLVVLLVGVGASAEVLRRKPLGTLRAE
jgi:putative ABC transport system permease protein